MTFYWLALIAAILCEVIATTSMKLSDGMTRIAPASLMLFFYILAGILLAVAMKRIDLSIAYGIWAGIGLVGTTLIGRILFDEPFSLAKAGCVVLIGIGAIGLYTLQTPPTS